MQCGEIFDLMGAAAGEAGDAVASPSGRLRIVNMPTFGNRYVSPLIAAFFTANPPVVIKYNSSPDPHDLLAEGIVVSVYLAQYLPDPALIALKPGSMVLCSVPRLPA